jgi:hypothetical protein
MSRTLRDHEELCSERYANIERRLTILENKVDGIHEIIEGFKTEIIRVAIKCFGLVFITICGAVFVIKM